MKQRNPAVKQYLAEIRRALSCPRNLKRAFIGNMRRMLSDVSPTATLAELYEEFGTPEAIADGFDRTENAYALRAYAKSLGRTTAVLASLSAVICTALVVLALIPNPFVPSYTLDFTSNSNRVTIVSVTRNEVGDYLVQLVGSISPEDVLDHITITIVPNGEEGGE